MAISELQLSLIVAGAAGVVGVFAYNKWQERRHRTHAERVFKSDHPDVLIDPPAAPASAEVERLEPVISAPEDVTPEVAGAGAPPAAETAVPAPSATASTEPAEIDRRIECAARVSCGEPVGANDFWLAQRAAFELIDKPLRWYMLDESSGYWRKLDTHSAGRYREYMATLQLADRRGPLTAGELVSFFEGLQQVGDKFLAVVEYPERDKVVEQATALDAFCASVDAQIAAHVVAVGEPFEGAQIQSLVESAGLQLRGDGMFHAEDASGNTLFTLSNAEAELFAAAEMANLRARGVTVTLDVPRVAEGIAAYDRMVALAIRLANALGGDLVDDNRNELDEAALVKIRQTVEQFQARMARHGIAAGSPAALRLFD